MKELKFQYIKFTMPLGPAEITEATDTWCFKLKSCLCKIQLCPLVSKRERKKPSVTTQHWPLFLIRKLRSTL
jgi:hypothetical protein